MNAFMNPTSFTYILWFKIWILTTASLSNFILNSSINMIHINILSIMDIIFFWYTCVNHIIWHTDLNSMSITLFGFFMHWNRYSSDHWNFLHIRLRNGIISLNFYLIELWFLNMMNIVLLIVFLNNWLSNSFFSRNSNCLKFFYIVHIAFSSQRI